MEQQVLITLVNLILTPILVIITMWVKSSTNMTMRREKREDGFIQGLEDRIAALEKRLDTREAEIREIRMELKNRDGEYITLYKEHTTLKAKYEVLLADHDDLKKQYAITASELEILKKDMKNRTAIAIHTMRNLENKPETNAQFQKEIQP